MLSIIVPVYNVEKYIQKCLDTVLQQTYDNYELILVDDGSTDNSADICDKYANKYSHVKVIHKKNGGLSSARNIGIENATGEFIIFLDSDDYWTSKNLLKNLNSVIQKGIDDKTIIVWNYQKVIDDYQVVESTLNNIKVYTLKEDYKYLFKSEILFASACYMAIPRKMFQDNGLLFELSVTSEDVEWFARILQRTENVIHIPTSYYAYRIRKGSISNSINENSIHNFKHHIDNINKINNNNIISTYLSEQIANYIITLASYKNYREEISISRQYIILLKNVVRKRSKIIFLSVSFLGLKNTVWLLRIMKRMK